MAPRCHLDIYKQDQKSNRYYRWKNSLCKLTDLYFLSRDAIASKNRKIYIIVVTKSDDHHG